MSIAQRPVSCLLPNAPSDLGIQRFVCIRHARPGVAPFDQLPPLPRKLSPQTIVLEQAKDSLREISRLAYQRRFAIDHINAGRRKRSRDDGRASRQRFQQFVLQPGADTQWTHKRRRPRQIRSELAGTKPRDFDAPVA